MSYLILLIANLNDYSLLLIYLHILELLLLLFKMNNLWLDSTVFVCVHRKLCLLNINKFQINKDKK